MSRCVLFLHGPHVLQWINSKALFETWLFDWKESHFYLARGQILHGVCLSDGKYVCNWGG